MIGKKGQRGSPLKLVGRMMMAMLAAFPPVAGQGRSEELPPQVREILSKWDNPSSPGGAVAVLQDGEVVLKTTFGMANLEHDIPITPRTVFCLGSVSKQFTAFCIALLEARGDLRLDDDIRTHIPEMPDYGVPITVRHLVHHTSGLRDHLMLMYLSGRQTGELHGAREVIDKVLSRQKIVNFKPGEKHEYSNSNYFLLGEIVRRVSGLSLRDFARKNIFEPLGMTDTQYHDDFTRIIKDRAASYYPGDNGGYRNYVDTFDLVGSGGVYSTIEDLILWVRNFEEPKAGGAGVIRKILRKGTLNDGREVGYSFGLEHDTLKGLKTVFHSGSHGGYGAMIRWFPEQRFVAICLSNFVGLDTRYVTRRIADVYLKDAFTEKPETYRIIDLPDKLLTDKAGLYQSPGDRSALKVSVRDGRLVCETNFSWPFEYAPVGRNEFKSVKPDVPMVLRFLESDGNPPFIVHSLYEGRETNVYHPAEFISLAAEGLREYAGVFASEELDATWRMVIEDGKLFVRFERAQRRAPQTFLRPTVRDEFAAWPSIFTFLRDKNGRVSGFVFGPDKKTGVEFKRLR